jgi:hypothetical protein
VNKSVDSLTCKVDNQYKDLTNTVNALSTVIERQNAVIAKIQHDFKVSMEALTIKLTHPFGSTSTSLLSASTSTFRQISSAG